MNMSEIEGAGENPFDKNGHISELMSLNKYMHDPAFAERFVNALVDGGQVIERTEYYPKEKAVEDHEMYHGGYEYFYDNQEKNAADFQSRLSEEIDADKVDIFLNGFRQLWIDGSTARHNSSEMMQIKASIRDHDNYYYPRRNIFVNKINSVPESCEALFSPIEMHKLFEITTQFADTIMEDYLASRSDKNSSSINRIYLHRGIFVKKQIIDDILVEENYLTSYSMAVTVPEVFAQTWTSATRISGVPTMVGAPYPLFSNRIVMFAPIIRGMNLGQLEICIAPPIEIFPLKYRGAFPSGNAGLNFHEYEFDSVPPGAIWSGALPDRIIRPR